MRGDEDEDDDQDTEQETGDRATTELARQPAPVWSVALEVVVGEEVGERSDDRTGQGRRAAEDQRQDVLDRGEDGERVLVDGADLGGDQPARHPGHRCRDAEGQHFGASEVDPHHGGRGLVVAHCHERAADSTLSQVAHDDVTHRHQHERDPEQIQRAVLSSVLQTGP